MQDLRINLGSGIVIIILEQEIDLHHGKKKILHIDLTFYLFYSLLL